LHTTIAAGWLALILLMPAGMAAAQQTDAGVIEKKCKKFMAAENYAAALTEARKLEAARMTATESLLQKIINDFANLPRADIISLGLSPSS